MAKVQKLFAALAAPPALSDYADPIPDNTAHKQLVPYVRQSTTSSSSVKNSKPLETHGLFKNYQSFHRLSGDNEKEARTAAYHDLTTLMLSQTDEPQLINVSSTRPKTEEPFPHSAVSSNEVKKNNEKMILQWPPQSSHTKVIDRTLGLYQHGPPPKVPMRSGLRPQSKIHGTSPLSLKNFPRLKKSLLQCRNAGIYIPHHLSCSVLPSLQRYRKCPTLPSRRVLPG